MNSQKKSFKSYAVYFTSQARLEALHARNETFDKVWNADGGLRGHRIWNAEDIVPEVYELLEQFIDND